MTLSKNPATVAIHGAFRKDLATNAVAVPIYQSTAFDLEGTDNAADLFALKKFGNIYSRIGNPTCDVLEQRMAALEGGVAALAVSSGQRQPPWRCRTSPMPATTSSARPTSMAVRGT